MSANGPKPPGSGNYEVGYGKPPIHTRFRKCQSGNPRGSTLRTKPWDRANQVMLYDVPSRAQAAHQEASHLVK